MDAVSQIKSRLSITDVVSRYVALKKAGRNMKGLCPFHDDHSPSFLVSEEKGLAWCFVCQNGGDIFSFIQKIESVDFPEALNILAEMAGVDLSKASPGKTSADKDKKLRLLSLLESAEEHFRSNYLQHKKVQEKVEERKISQDTIQKFGIGYAKDEFHDLENALLKKGYSRKEMLDSGVVTVSDGKGQEVYDRFRKRIMFPIADHHGSLRGFGGRIFKEGEPKYLNSPESVLYEKSKILYGLNFAVDAIKKKDFCLITEGYFDVIACHNAGIDNTVSVSGVALSESHIKLLHRFTKNIVFAFDADPAGREATKRAIQTAIQAGSNVFVVSIPGGKDPDESLRGDREAFPNALEARTPVMDYLLSALFEGKNPDHISDKRAILDEFLPFLSLFPSDLEQGFYVKKLSDRLKTPEMVVQKELIEWKKKNTHERRIPKAEKLSLSSPVQEAISPFSFLVGYFGAFPDLLPSSEGTLLADLIPENTEKKFYNAMLKEYNTTGALHPKVLLTEFSEEEAKHLELLTLYCEEHGDKLPEDTRKDTVKKVIKNLNKALITREQRILTEALKQTPKCGSEEKEILKKLHDLTRLIARF